MITVFLTIFGGRIMSNEESQSEKKREYIIVDFNSMSHIVSAFKLTALIK
jgi:hypothetical protein